MENNNTNENKTTEIIGVSEKFANNLKNDYWNVLYNDVDCVIVISGREGFGKSTLAIHTWRYIDQLRQKWGLKPTFTPTRIAVTAKQFSRQIDEIPDNQPGNVLMYDEAAGGLYNRRSMSKENVAINQILLACRYKNLIVILNIPNFFAIDKEVRTRRVGYLLNCYGKSSPIDFKTPSGEVERIEKINKGYFNMYTSAEIKKIKRNDWTGQTIYPKISDDLTGLRFTSADSHPYWKSYKDYIYHAKGKFISDAAERLNLPPKKGSTSKLSKDDLVKNSKLKDFQNQPPYLSREEKELINGEKKNDKPLNLVFD